MTLLPPTPEQQKIINQEIPPDPEIRRKDVQALREWLMKQPHLPKHMERYFTARTALPEFFLQRDPMSRDVQECCKVIEYFVLPSLTDEGHRVTVLRLKDKDINKFSVQAITRRILMVMDTRLTEEACLSNQMVFDLEGFTAAHIAKCSPTQALVRKAMLAAQDSMPLRLHRVYFLNAPTFIHNLLNIFYPLLKPKLVEKFRIHTGGGEELWPYMNKEILPKEWEGNAGTFQQLNDAWKKKIEKYRDWFKEEESLSKTDEKVRMPTSSSSSFTRELSGIQGSFRQLNID
ncbi:GSCOCG00008316001-RA-CDS [Cotesia congregata]|nr:GSCOCG00008316001-RA-CDS [Cotesia congregata]